MSLKYNNFIFDWGVVSEKKYLNSVYTKVSDLSTEILNDKSAFSLKSRTADTNEYLIG